MLVALDSAALRILRAPAVAARRQLSTVFPRTDLRQRSFETRSNRIEFQALALVHRHAGAKQPPALAFCRL
jgi:hypothetical protein